MPRTLTLIAACALAVFVCAPARGQDSPSLGDLARQAQKDKEKNKASKPAAKVITNDDVNSASGGPMSSLSSGFAAGMQSGATGKPGEIQSPAEGLERMQTMLDQFDSLDRAGLATLALDGNEANFPGRAKWEEKVFAAKQTFVSQGRAVLAKMTQVVDATQGMKDIQDPNDPRIKSVTAALEQLLQASQQNTATFQAVIAEGKDLAAKASAH